MKKTTGLLLAIFISFSFTFSGSHSAKDVQKKLMIYAKDSFGDAGETLFVKITGEKYHAISNVGSGYTYANAPQCGSPGTITVDVVDGKVYTVTGACRYKNTIIMYGPATVTISAVCTSISVPF